MVASVKSEDVYAMTLLRAVFESLCDDPALLLLQLSSSPPPAVVVEGSDVMRIGVSNFSEDIFEKGTLLASI